MSAAWKAGLSQHPALLRFPDLAQLPAAWAAPRNSDKLRDVQRTAAAPLLQHERSCPRWASSRRRAAIFRLPATRNWRGLICPLVERDNYGKAFAQADHAPRSEEGMLHERQRKMKSPWSSTSPWPWNDAVASQFYLDGEKAARCLGAASGNVVTLKLRRPPPPAASPTSTASLEPAQPALRGKRHRRADVLRCRDFSAAALTTPFAYVLTVLARLVQQ